MATYYTNSEIILKENKNNERKRENGMQKVMHQVASMFILKIHGHLITCHNMTKFQIVPFCRMYLCALDYKKEGDREKERKR